LEKVSGIWQWHVNNNTVSDKYNPNDMGFLLYPNEVTTRGEVSYNLYRSTRHFISQRYAFSALQSYLYKPFAYQKTEFTPSVSWVFKNFWDVELSVPIETLLVQRFF